MIVVDASVAVRWFVAEEAGREAAMEVLDQIHRSPESFAVPDLFYVEMLNVLSRLTSTTSELQRYVAALFDLGFVQVRVGAKLLHRAAAIALESKLSGYDALYVAVAESLSGTWITGDVRAHNKIKTLNLSRVV